MSGPYSQEEAEHILRGPFYASPLIVAEHNQGPNLPPKPRVCRNLSKDDKASGMGSVNSFVEKEFFPTHFDMAQDVEDVVSLFLGLARRACVAPLATYFLRSLSIFSLVEHISACGACLWVFPMLIWFPRSRLRPRVY